MVEMHETIKPEKLVCLICNKTFVTKEVLSAHNMVIHDIPKRIEDQV
jgi:glucose-6-phosphate isomerase